MAIHELKCWPPYFQDVLDGHKTFELRHDDRAFAVGDTLHIVEYEPADNGRLTGRECDRFISYVMRNSAFLPGAYVCLGLWSENEAAFQAEIAALSQRNKELQEQLVNMALRINSLERASFTGMN